MNRTMWWRRRGWALLLLVCPLSVVVLIEVPIWIALSSTVILYNSKSADDVQKRSQLRRPEYLYTNLDFPYVSHPKYHASSFAE